MKPQALEVRLVLASDTSTPADASSIIDSVPGELPTTITLAWTGPSFAAVEGIVHAPSAKPELKIESRDALLTAIVKARGWIDEPNCLAAGLWRCRCLLPCGLSVGPARRRGKSVPNMQLEIR